MKDSVLQNSRTSLIIIIISQVLLLVFCVAVMLGNIWLLYKHINNTVYLESISGSQYLVRNAQNGEVIHIISGYPLLTKKGFIESSVLGEDTTVALINEKKDYFNTSVALTSFTLQLQNFLFLHTLKGDLQGNTLNLTYRVEAQITDSETKYLSAIKYPEGATFVENNGTFQFVSGDCKVLIIPVLGKFSANQEQNHLAFFEYNNQELTLQLTYDCSIR